MDCKPMFYQKIPNIKFIPANLKIIKYFNNIRNTLFHSYDLLLTTYDYFTHRKPTLCTAYFAFKLERMAKRKNEA